MLERSSTARGSVSSAGGSDPSLSRQSSAQQQQQQQQQHALSCTHCRQRKVKCNKSHPCLPCQRANLECVFPERARHPKKKKHGAKSTNDELLARLSRMEQLIGRMEKDGKTIPEESSQPAMAPQTSPDPPSMEEIRLIQRASHSPSDPRSHEGSASPTQNLNRFIAGSFWQTLSGEVEGFRQALDDGSDGEENSPHSNSSLVESHSASHGTLMFGSTFNTPQNLRQLHPSPAHMMKMHDLYAENVDTVMKVLHIPTSRSLVSNAIANLDEIPTDNYVEPLLFSIYYAAITSLTNDECLQSFQDSRDNLLSRYQAGLERAFANADFMSTTELGTLQALSIYILTLRSNDHSQLSWTLFATALRLAHGMGLHREAVSVGLSPFTLEMRRRCWWALVALDGRCCEDRASEPLINRGTFSTKRPLNINDEDMWPEMTSPPPERDGFTEMSKCSVSHEVSAVKWRMGFFPRFENGREIIVPLPFDEQMIALEEIETALKTHYLNKCDTTIPIAWVTSVVTRLIMCRIRLVIFHPIQIGETKAERPNVPRERLLETAVANMEYSHLLDVEPAAAKWRWYFRTYVQWHALATALAELCVQTEGPLVDRAWRIVETVFDDWSSRIADSPNGTLWRPMKKLRAKAQTKRYETKMRKQAILLQQQQQQQQQQPLPQFESLGFTAPDSSLLSPGIGDNTFNVIPQDLNLDQAMDFSQALPSTELAGAGTGIDEPGGTVNWAEWDAFMQDFETEDPNKVSNTSMGMNVESNRFDVWW